MDPSRIPLPARIAATLLYAGLLASVSLVSGRPSPGDSVFVFAVAAVPQLFQAVMHAVCYGALTLAIAWCLVPARTLRRALWIGIVLAGTFGASLEVAQLWIPGRFASLGDAVVNVAGGVIAAVIASRTAAPLALRSSRRKVHP